MNRRGVRTAICKPSRRYCKMARGYALPPVHCQGRTQRRAFLDEDGVFWRENIDDDVNAWAALGCLDLACQPAGVGVFSLGVTCARQRLDACLVFPAA